MVADVFDEEGRFLGPVTLPDGIRYHVRPHIRGDTVVALLEDAEGTRIVKRYLPLQQGSLLGNVSGFGRLLFPGLCAQRVEQFLVE